MQLCTAATSTRCFACDPSGEGAHLEELVAGEAALAAVAGDVALQLPAKQVRHRRVVLLQVPTPHALRLHTLVLGTSQVLLVLTCRQASLGVLVATGSQLAEAG